MAVKKQRFSAPVFKRKISWAILSTNVFGMPLMPVFVGQILNIPFRELTEAMTRTPYFFTYGLGSLGTVAVTFLLIHYLLVMRYMKPIIGFLASEDQAKSESKEEAYRVVKLAQAAPFVTMYLSLIFYAAGILVLLFVSFLPVFRLTFGQAVSLFFGSLCIGGVISFFQYFTTRKVLILFIQDLLAKFPEMVEDPELNQARHRIRNKTMLSTVTFCMSLVILTGSLCYSNAVASFQIHNGEVYLDRLNLQGVASSLDSFNLFSKELKIDYEDYIILTDDRGRLISGEVPPGMEKLWTMILHPELGKLTFNVPLIFKLSSDEIYSGVWSHERHTIVHRPVDSEHHVFVFIPEKTHEASLNLVWGFIIFAVIFALLITFIYTRFAAVELDMPLGVITQSIQEVAKGNLQETVLVLSQDEIGVLSLNLNKMITSLRAMIGKIDQASHSVSETNNKLTAHSDQIEQGAALQASSVEETSASMEEMNLSNRQIAESVETLARSAEESSASILQMGATIDEVAKNVETLSEAVEETTSSLQEMNASLQEVATNVQQLSNRSNEAVKSLQEMENGIRVVGDSSQQTASLSEQVSEDADQGAKAVEMTIKGIERIRKSSEEAAVVIDSLSERAQEIGNILNVIDDITEETNLLALNAAIIAAQAGEHGKGFAVVADEIRDLAERTSASTKEISELIKSVQEGAQNAVATVFKSSKDVEEGVRLSQEAGAALSQILQRARVSMERTREIASGVARQRESIKGVMGFFENINAMITQVAQAIQEQSRGSDLIFKASQRMEQVAQQVKRAIREQTLGSKQITQAIENISQIVNYINTAQNEQIKNSQTVLEAVKHIRKVAEENTERVKEVKRMVEGLSFLSRDLNEMVEEFKIGGDGQSAATEVFKL